MICPGAGAILANAMQSALDPAAREAGKIAQLWWIYFWVLTAVFGAVAVWLFIAISKSRTHVDTDKIDIVAKPEPQLQRRATRVVSTCLVVTVLILFALLITDFFAGNAVYTKPDPNAKAIKITGHQWWWEVEYQDPQPSEIMTTANELHVPVGKTVKLELRSNDVIHSFWVPNMHGKKDLVPGIPTTTWFVANRAGEFRGQCAEYCGDQHAHMRLVFVAENEPDFSNWLSAQKKSAPEPTTDSQRRGREVFLSSQCMMCHAIQGTNARAALGPDLTHIGSRKLLAAGEIPNTPGNLARWIDNPQNIKPGVRMPANKFAAEDLAALVDYLESLK
jgi:cytochrome c oxidase subunit 2